MSGLRSDWVTDQKPQVKEQTLDKETSRYRGPLRELARWQVFPCWNSILGPTIYKLVLSFFLRIFLKTLFLDRGEKERERNIHVWLPLLHPQLGTWSTTQACALTGNGTSDPLVHRPALNTLSHTTQGTNWCPCSSNRFLGVRWLDQRLCELSVCQWTTTSLKPFPFLASVTPYSHFFP